MLTWIIVYLILTALNLAFVLWAKGKDTDAWNVSIAITPVVGTLFSLGVLLLTALWILDNLRRGR